MIIRPLYVGEEVSASERVKLKFKFDRFEILFFSYDETRYNAFVRQYY